MEFQSLLRYRSYILLGAIFLCVFAAFAWQFYNRGASVQAHRIAAACADESKPQNCVAAKILSLIERNGDSGAAFKVVRELNESQPWMGGQCSNIATAVGRQLYKDKPDYHFIHFGPESVYCNYAFIQEYLRQMLPATKDLAMAKAYCAGVGAALNRIASDASAECYRAVGQSLPFIDDASQGDPPKMIAYAIRSCEQMTSVATELNLCVGGAFNYLDVHESLGDYGLSINKSDPTGICRVQKGNYRDICYGNFKRVVLAGMSGGTDFGMEVTKLTTQNPDIDPESLNLVIRTLGYDAATNSSGDPDYVGLVHSCATLGTSAQQGLCMQGLGLGFAKNGAPGDQYLELKKLCDAAEVIRGIEGQCPGYNALSYLKGVYTPAKFEQSCVLLGATADPLCK